MISKASHSYNYLHQWNSGSPEKETPGGDVGEPLDDDDGLVPEEVRQEEDDDEDSQVRVRPHRVDIIVSLNKQG